METLDFSPLKKQLEIRRERITKSVKHLPDPANLLYLLKQVDSALEKMDEGNYGICEVCHGHVEEERLLIDPLISVCLGCLNDQQQRALEDDLEFAAKIQRNLLPKKNLKIDGWEFSYHYSPAGAVSGDFVDLIPLNDDSVIFVIGDVSGKGISASLMMSHLHAMIHSLISFGMNTGEIVEKVNRLFCESTLYTNYATMILGKVTPSGEAEICVAGHNPPVVLKNRSVHTIAATGIPIGLMSEAKFTTEKFQLDKNDVILLYTDGLTESSFNDIEYGEERVKRQLSDNGMLPPKDLIDELLNDHKNYLNGSSPADDITVLSIKKN